jgi:hypothetical protein
MSEPLFGKKVFFLNPPGVLTDVASVLGTNEFEVYLVYDHGKLAATSGRTPTPWFS